jgi:hypothetical protein
MCREVDTSWFTDTGMNSYDPPDLHGHYGAPHHMPDTDHREGAAILSVTLLFSSVLLAYGLIIGEKVHRLQQPEASCSCPLPSIQPTTTKAKGAVGD